MRLMLPLIAVAALSACASPEQIASQRAADAARVPAARVTGPAQRCIPLSQLRQSLVRSDGVIDFKVGQQLYRNTLPQSCPGLGFEQRITYAVSQGQLCSVDTITVLLNAPVARGATCGLGEFVPITLESDAAR